MLFRSCYQLSSDSEHKETPYMIEKRDRDTHPVPPVERRAGVAEEWNDSAADNDTHAGQKREMIDGSLHYG